jgi:outer membrane lipoprotein SlyB
MRTLLLAALAPLLVLAGCATTSAPPRSGEATVVSITEGEQTSTGAAVAGSVGGAIVGAVIGSQFGGGSGQTIASIIGSVGGSMAGSAIANRAGRETVWDVRVRFDDGIDRVVRVRERPDYRPGDRVRVSEDAVARL